jgi:hypothetical protein
MRRNFCGSYAKPPWSAFKGIEPDAHSKMRLGVLLMAQGISLATPAYRCINAALSYGAMLALTRRLSRTGSR